MENLSSNQTAMFDQIWSLNKSYVQFACNNFSTYFRHLTVDDLLQDCAIKLLGLIRSERSEKLEELSMIFKTSVYNMLKDEYRKHKRKEILIEVVKLGWTDITYNMQNDINFNSFVDAISIMLKSDLDRSMFKCLIEPDQELLDVVFDDGKVEIEKKHVAKRFNVSPATISRFLVRLNHLTLNVIEMHH